MPVSVSESLSLSLSLSESESASASPSGGRPVSATQSPSMLNFWPESQVGVGQARRKASNIEPCGNRARDTVPTMPLWLLACAEPAVVETPVVAVPDVSDLAAEIVELPAITVAYVEVTAPPTRDGLESALGPAYARLAEAGVVASGMPIIVTRSEGEVLALWAALPASSAGSATTATLGGGRGVRAVVGSQAGLPAAHQRLRAWMEAKDIQRLGLYWEQFRAEGFEVVYPVR